MAKVTDIRPKKKEVDLGDGIKREVKFTLNAMADLEEKYGSIDAAFEALDQGRSISAMRYMLWAVLDNDASQPITEREVGAMLTMENMAQVMEMLSSAFEDAAPADATKSKNPK